MCSSSTCTVTQINLNVGVSVNGRNAHDMIASLYTYVTSSIETAVTCSVLNLCVRELVLKAIG